MKVTGRVQGNSVILFQQKQFVEACCENSNTAILFQKKLYAEASLESD
jgi:hypothetical protein